MDSIGDFSQPPAPAPAPESGALVTLAAGGEPRASSLAIAQGTAVEHKAVIQLTRTYLADLEEFGRVAFEMAPFETPGGTQSREVALLNEPQATLLMTYMRNSEIVRKFKMRLVKAFFELRNRAQVQRVPQTLPEALRLAAELAEQRAALESRVQVLEPKAQGLDRISATGCRPSPTVV